MESGTTVRPHDNEVDPLSLGGLENFLERHAVDDDDLAFQPCRRDALKTGLHAARALCFQVLEIGVREGHTHVDTS